jgi:DNA replication and repair protein RecF
MNGAPVRTDASQGQHRLLTLSLKLAEMECIAQSVGVRPLLLLDDVSSELDAGRTEQLFQLVAERHDQMLVTTTRPELLTVLDELVGGMQVFEVQQGSVRLR